MRLKGNLIILFYFNRFYFESERGLFPNTEFVFDLELPLEFVPKNADGEVEKFELLPADQCLERLFSPDFKTTSAPVILDFLIRHGLVSPEFGESMIIIITFRGRVYRYLFIKGGISFKNEFCLISISSKEPNYTRIIELLHVPLQTIYKPQDRLPKENGQVAKYNMKQ